MATMVNINSLLKIADSEELSKFLHLCVDDLIGRKVNFENYNSDVELTKEELKKAQLCIQTLYKNCIVNNEGNFELKADLSEKTIQVVQKCYEIRKEEIREHVVKERLFTMKDPVVQNIDWKLKWIVGSSKLATLSEPVLQVDLHCSHEEKKSKTVNFEMNYEQVEQMIARLEELKIKLSENK